MGGRVRFIIVVFMAFVLLFAVQKPLYYVYGNGEWTGLGSGERMLALLSGLFFDMVLAAALSIVPALFTCLFFRLPERVGIVCLRAYFLLSSLGIAAVFAFAAWPFGYPLLRLLLFILSAAWMTSLFWERVIPLLERSVGEVHGRHPLLAVAVGLMLLLPICGGVLTASNRERIYDPDFPELYHLAVNPYYELVCSLHDGAGRR